METTTIDLSKISIEELVEKRNKLSVQIRFHNYIGQKGREHIENEIQRMDREIEKRREKSQYAKDEY